jgi:hypothetical protein
MSTADALVVVESERSEGKRWASLADRLNPNRAAFDPAFKAEWSTMGKKQRKRVIAEDRRQIQELKSRAAKNPLPFTADPDDHCETSPGAYTHISPLLRLIAKRLGKSPSKLEIYDPYFCAGGMVKHLETLGFDRIHNKAEDFYKVLAEKRVPIHDVVVTNPPYSADHFERMLDFLRANGKPCLLLLPDHFSRKECYRTAEGTWFHSVFLTPPERYHYWTPEGLRPEEDKKKSKHRNVFLGNRNSPFSSHWFISLAPLLSKEQLLSLPPSELELPSGCKLHGEITDAESAAPAFRGVVGDDSDDGERVQRKKRRRKEKKATNS